MRVELQNLTITNNSIVKHHEQTILTNMVLYVYHKLIPDFGQYVSMSMLQPEKESKLYS